MKEKLFKKKPKKKKGFTLVELLAVIVILAVIMVITIPTVLGSINKSKEKAFESVGQSMKEYLKKNYESCKLNNPNVAKYDGALFKSGTCELVDDYSDVLIENSGYSKDDIEKVEVIDNGNGDYVIKVTPKSDGQFEGNEEYATGEIVYRPNEPDIAGTNLKPVFYDTNTNTWVLISENDSRWYDYEKQEWANAVSLKTSKNTGESLDLDSDVYAMFVWIPRFSYTIGCKDGSCLGYKDPNASDLTTKTPGAIDIKFVSKSVTDELVGDYPTYNYTNESDRNPTNYYTHPAFNFGDTKLSGIWVGKFETTGSVDAPTILPNKVSLGYNTPLGTMYNSSLKFSESGNIYGISGDSHVIKNNEWSAVAYLSQSKYGKYGNSLYHGDYKVIFKNNSTKTYTGKSSKGPFTTSYSQNGTTSYDDLTYIDNQGYAGAGASTTGNISGIYDMAHGNPEYVMGWYKYRETTFGNAPLGNNAAFTVTPPQNHYQILNEDIYAYDINMVGGAINETKGWCNGATDGTEYGNPWLVRGNHSVFAVNNNTGGNSNYTIRVVLVNK